MKKVLFAAILLMAQMTGMAKAEEQGQEVKPLFAYPQVPDTIQTLENRTNYLVSKFWDNYDVSKPITNKASFEKTFADYLEFFMYAHKTVVTTSLRNFLNKLQSNTANMLYVADLSGKYLYEPNALYWSDEVYEPFVRAVLSMKKIKKADKERYKLILDKLVNNKVGQKVPDVDIVSLDGSKKKLSSIVNSLTLLFFIDENCEDCVLSRLRLSTDVNVNRLIKEGSIHVVCVTPNGYSKEWADKVKGWSDNWTIVCSNNLDAYDIRLKPSVFAVNEKFELLNKNLTVEGIINMFNQ